MMNLLAKSWLKGSFGCRKAERDSFASSRIQLTISVGQSHHENERLAVTIDAINKYPPLEVVIMLDDSLQWRSLKIDNQLLTDEDAFELAVRSGDEWLERNFSTYNSLKVPYQIVRWKDWLGTPVYVEAVAFATKAYTSNPIFKTAIDANVASYLKRKPHLEPTSALFSRAEKLSRLYCLEEAGVMAKLWTQPPLACQYEIYPSKRNEAMSAAFDLWIKDESPGILHPITLRFNRRTSLE